jgi:hypothetical protein
MAELGSSFFQQIVSGSFTDPIFQLWRQIKAHLSVNFWFGNERGFESHSDQYFFLFPGNLFAYSFVDSLYTPILILVLAGLA